MARKQKKFEEALGELEEIIRNLEEGNVTLEESIKKYKTGIDLASQCLNVLKQAEQEIFVYEQEGYKKLEGVEEE